MILGNGFVILSSQVPGPGEPCNGCGFCCQDGPCEVATEILGAEPSKRCVALEWDGKSKYRCGMVTRPHAYIDDLGGKEWADSVMSTLIQARLGIGQGCYVRGGLA